MRITDSNSNLSKASQINTQRARMDKLQEHLTTGKRINRASDDPAGAEAVIRLKTSLAEVEGYQRNAQTVNQKLVAADAALTSYAPMLDKMRSLVSAGYTDTATPETRRTIAVELEGLRERVLSVANQRNGDDYLFGGTRQNVPPFDPATAAPAAAPTAAQYVALEPGGVNAVASGVTANTVFSDATSTIFDDLTAAIDALRGTGDAAADKTTLSNTLDRLKIYTDLAGNAQARVGVTMKNVELAADRLGADTIAFETEANDIEAADFVETAVRLSEARNAFEATLQVTAQSRRSLLDFLG